MQLKKIDMAAMAGGGLLERMNDELQVVLKNINDINTKPEAVRKLVATIEFKPDKERRYVATKIVVTSRIAPANEIVGTMVMVREQGRLELYEENVKQGELFERAEEGEKERAGKEATERHG
jgi:hypothetical protein